MIDKLKAEQDPRLLGINDVIDKLNEVVEVINKIEIDVRKNSNKKCIRIGE